MIKKKYWFSFIFALLWFISSFIVTPQAYAYTEEEKLLLQSWRLVNQSYLDDTFNHQNWWFVRQELLKKPLHNREETYAAITEMLTSLDDPYTRLLKPDQYHNLQITTSGELSGIGLQISINPDTNQLEVVTPLPQSPAELAGLQPRDVILEIDGVDASSLTLDEAATKIRGTIGSKVVLKFKPQDQAEIKTVEIVRESVSLNPVFAQLDTFQDNLPLGYIRLSQFSGNATQEVAHAIAKLQEQGAKGYLLDLRNNPGGLLQAGVEIASLWLQPSTIVYTVNRDGTLGSFDSPGTPISDVPLVVLVNGGTASASEILAGALQDNDRAILVGEKTFGKGLIQSLFELPDGAGIAITVAKYETPNHNDINKLGITPDKIVTQEPISYFKIGTEEDQQYQTAINTLAELVNSNA
jgi:carboxyl-terminal processing protease